MVADTVLPLTPYPRSPEVIRYSQPTKPPGSGGLMILRVFAPKRRKNTRFRISPPQEWGGLGGVDHLTITKSVQ